MDRTGYPEAELLSVYRDWGVVRKSSRDDNFNRASDDLSTYKLVNPGDLVLNKMKTWQGSLAVSNYRGIVSPAYFVCELSSKVDGRFIHHLLRSNLYVAMYASASKGIRPNQWDLPWDAFRELPVALPSQQEQRRIADFLDDQVARIDNVIAARQRQHDLLASQVAGSADRVLTLEDWTQATRLGRFIHRIEQGWSPQCDAVPAADDEWGVLKVSSIRAGTFIESENKRLPDDLKPAREYEVEPGDLLITRANTPSLVGLFAVAPRTVRRKLIFSDKIMRVSLRAGLSSEFVALIGQTRRVRDLLSAAGTGTSQSMVNIRGTDIRDLPMPVLEEPKQNARVAEQLKLIARLRSGQHRLYAQLARLTELKRSLITAAVSGEFDVSSADGSRVPV